MSIRLFLPVILSTFLFSALQTTSNNNFLFNPNNAVIAWDFHDVLVKKDWSAMTNQIISIVKKDWKVVGLLFWPPFLKELYDAYTSCIAAEDLLQDFTKKYPSLAPHKNDLLNLVNIHIPIPASVEILKELKKQGYKNYLASNIGQKSFKIARQKFPEIFAQFEGTYFPKKNIQDGQAAAAKPCLDYYLDLRNYLALEGVTKDNTIIFIDDRYQNILGAHNSNHHELNHVYGIHFSSPEQLEKTLKKIMVFD
jgi:FMN phosphatase YigB (HAD superfamily)